MYFTCEEMGEGCLLRKEMVVLETECQGFGDT